MEIKDEARPDRPISMATEENIQLAKSTIEQDPHSICDHIEAETLLSPDNIYSHPQPLKAEKSYVMLGVSRIDIVSEATKGQLLQSQEKAHRSNKCKIII